MPRRDSRNPRRPKQDTGIHTALPSPWLTLEEAAARARLAPDTLRKKLAALRWIGEEYCGGTRGRRVIHVEVLDDLIMRGFRPSRPVSPRRRGDRPCSTRS
jgi:hypothetical protein